jgi:hypothetical protein
MSCPAVLITMSSFFVLRRVFVHTGECSHKGVFVHTGECTFTQGSARLHRGVFVHTGVCTFTQESVCSYRGVYVHTGECTLTQESACSHKSWHCRCSFAYQILVYKTSLALRCVYVCLTLIGLARTIYIRCVYGIFGRESTIFTVIYSVYTRFWPTVDIKLSGAASHSAPFLIHAWCVDKRFQRSLKNTKAKEKRINDAGSGETLLAVLLKNRGHFGSGCRKTSSPKEG